MSITATYSVFCDVNGPTCTSWIAQTNEGPRAARAEAKAVGWTRTKGPDGLLDVCPPCQFEHPVCSWCGADLAYNVNHARWYHETYDRDCRPHADHTVAIEAAT